MSCRNKIEINRNTRTIQNRVAVRLKNKTNRCSLLDKIEIHHCKFYGLVLCLFVRHLVFLFEISEAFKWNIDKTNISSSLIIESNDLRHICHSSLNDLLLTRKTSFHPNEMFCLFRSIGFRIRIEIEIEILKIITKSNKMNQIEIVS